MTIAVLGAAGIIGREIAHILATEDQQGLRIGDVRAEAVRALGKEIGAEAFVADADPQRLPVALRGVDVAVNATPYPFNLDVMHGCLAAGCDYIDLGGLYHMTRRQLGLHDRFRDAGRVAVLGCGKAPG
ncbi:MAG: saccharopine dehydrogenase NADP-binding domain-containing protein, partial [Methanobacteriota archaeon]